VAFTAGSASSFKETGQGKAGSCTPRRVSLDEKKKKTAIGKEGNVDSLLICRDREYNEWNYGEKTRRALFNARRQLYKFGLKDK